MNIEVSVIIGIAGVASSIAFGYLGYDKGKKKECKDDGKKQRHAIVRYWIYKIRR